MRAKGDYIIVIGGRAGAVYDGHSWKSFECRFCVPVPLTNRIGTNDSPTARRKAYSKYHDYMCQSNPKHR